LEDAAAILLDILEEEKAADETLTEVAVATINVEAVAEDIWEFIPAKEDMKMENESQNDVRVILRLV
jgi:glyoxylate utilization-related uncharacterized protein